MVNWVGTDRADVFHGSPVADRLDGQGKDDELYGGDGDDRILGGSGPDRLYGEAGNDSLDGEEDRDVLHGGDGNDVLTGGEDDDLISGEGGKDTIDGGPGDDYVAGLDDDDVIVCGDGNDQVYGGAGRDTIRGRGTLGANAGSSTVHGEEDDDTISGGFDADQLFGDDGDDRLTGFIDDDVLDGGAGNDTLDGEQGADTILGGDGNDVITNYDPGDDVMTGGLGRDTFTFGSTSRTNNTITDFNLRPGENDVVDLTVFFADHVTLLKASAVLVVDGVMSTRITLGNGGSVTLGGYDITKDASLETHFRVGASATFDLLALTAEQQITATYAAFLGRQPDATGLAFWVDQFNAGSPTQGPAPLFANIASSFGASAEARALHPFLANPFGGSDSQIGTFIDSVYHNLFDRRPDAAGLAYWTDQAKQALHAGQSVSPIVADIMSGARNHDMTTLTEKAAASDTAHGASVPETVMLVGITNDDTSIAVQA